MKCCVLSLSVSALHQELSRSKAEAQRALEDASGNAELIRAKDAQIAAVMVRDSPFYSLHSLH
jgi:hypothetical protein